MTMQGQGESQPGEPLSLDSLAAQLDGGDAEAGDDPGSDEPEGSEVEVAEGEQSDEAAEGEDGEEPIFTITHDGKEVTHKQSEILELAQKGYDYSKKTMALADERKALEPIKAKAEELRQYHEHALNESAARLNAVVQFMTAELGEPPPVEWASQDAGYYIAQKEQYESRKGKLEKAQYALQHTQMEQARSRQASIHQRIAETQRVLKDTLPDWNDAKETELADYVGKAGLTPDKSDMAFWDAGFWQIAHKAKQYDALMAEKAKLKPVNQLQKVHKPSANNQPPQLAKRQEAMKAHRAKGSLQTLADLL
jgi:hypothetical protein